MRTEATPGNHHPPVRTKEAKHAVPETTPSSPSSSTVSSAIVPEEFGANEWLVEEMYDRFQADPSSVDQTWVDYFKAHGNGTPDGGSANGSPSQPHQRHRRTTRPSPSRSRPSPRPPSPRPPSRRRPSRRSPSRPPRQPTSTRPRPRPGGQAAAGVQGRGAGQGHDQPGPQGAAPDRPGRRQRRADLHRAPRRPRPYGVQHGRLAHRARPRPRSARCRSSCCGTTARSSTTTSPARAAARCRSPT